MSIAESLHQADNVVAKMIEIGPAKARLTVKDLLIRGFLSRALLGFATMLVLTATTQTGLGPDLCHNIRHHS